MGKNKAERENYRYDKPPKELDIVDSELLGGHVFFPKLISVIYLAILSFIDDRYYIIGTTDDRFSN